MVCLHHCSGQEHSEDILSNVSLFYDDDAFNNLLESVTPTISASDDKSNSDTDSDSYIHCDDTTTVAIPDINGPSSSFHEDFRESVEPETYFRCSCTNCSIESYFKRECPNSSPIVLPYLDGFFHNEADRENVVDRLLTELKNIICEFSDLVSNTIQYLQKYLDTSLNTEALVSAELERSTSLNSRRADLIITRIKTLFQDNHISFFNYHIVAGIIQQFGRSEDKEALHRYVAHFLQFCERSVFEVPEDIFGSVPSGSEKVAIKVTRNLGVSLEPATTPDNNDSVISIHEHSLTGEETSISISDSFKFTLGDAFRAKEELAKALDIKNTWSVVYHGACRGSVELFFSIPKDKIKPQIDSKSILEASGMHMLCGSPGQPFASKVTNKSIWLHWKKPNYGEVQCYIIHYQYIDDCSKKWNEIQTQEACESIILGDLSSDSLSFVFKVKAVSKKGPGLASVESYTISLLTPLCSETTTPGVSSTMQIILPPWTPPHWTSNTSTVETYQEQIIALTPPRRTPNTNTVESYQEQIGASIMVHEHQEVCCIK